MSVESSKADPADVHRAAKLLELRGSGDVHRRVAVERKLRELPDHVHAAAKAKTAAVPAAEEPGALDDALHAAKVIAEGTGIMPAHINGSVGRQGSNQPEDVEAVKVRLTFLGYDAGSDLDGLIGAIEKYQQAVVGIHPPDGRVDVGGKTIAALVAGSTKAAHPAPAARAKPADKGAA